MAVCVACGREMTEGLPCTAEAEEFPDGQVLARSTEHFGGEPGGHCHDCGAPNGGLHHLGCDVERCARCGGQRISCSCFGEEDEV